MLEKLSRSGMKEFNLKLICGMVVIGVAFTLLLFLLAYLKIMLTNND